MYISPEVVHKMMNNIKNDTEKNSVIEELLKSNKYLFFIVDFDNELLKHKI